MKTAMKQFQSWMRESDDGELSEDGKYIIFSTEILEDKVIELLETERQQIINAWGDGLITHQSTHFTAEEYYNTTFTTPNAGE